MNINTYNSKKEASNQAALKGEQIIGALQKKKSIIRIVLATGASQLQMLDKLVTSKKINWQNCEIYHLDEYIGLSPEHPASFVKFLNERFISKIPSVALFEKIRGNSKSIDDELLRLNSSIQSKVIDIAFIGIGENSHLAFNDPPANFETKSPYLEVSLDSKCRNQQVKEGWFESFDLVPQKAITMSIKQILSSNKIICTALDTRKAKAVSDAIKGPYTNLCPASALQNHKKTYFYLDHEAAKLLPGH